LHVGRSISKVDKNIVELLEHFDIRPLLCEPTPIIVPICQMQRITSGQVGPDLSIELPNGNLMLFATIFQIASKPFRREFIARWRNSPQIGQILEYLQVADQTAFDKYIPGLGIALRQIAEPFDFAEYIRNGHVALPDCHIGDQNMSKLLVEHVLSGGQFIACLFHRDQPVKLDKYLTQFNYDKQAIYGEITANTWMTPGLLASQI
jgi:hypothetical protein